jgi:hypothetical protein
MSAASENAPTAVSASDPNVRKAITRFKQGANDFKVLERLGVPAIPALLQVIRDPTERDYMRQNAIQIIGHMKPDPVQTLRDLLKDPDPDVRLLAITYSNDWGNEGQALLLELLNDKSEDSYLRYKAAIQLIKRAEPGIRLIAMRNLSDRPTEEIERKEGKSFDQMPVKRYLALLLEEASQRPGWFVNVNKAKAMKIAHIEYFTLDLLKHVTEDPSRDDKRAVIYAVISLDETDGPLDKMGPLEDAVRLGYRPIVRYAGSEDEAINAMTDPKYEGIASILYIVGHGFSGGIWFNEHSSISAKSIKKFAGRPVILKKNGIVILLSCGACDNSPIPFLIPAGVEAVIARIFPDTGISYAPHGLTDDAKIIKNQDGTIEVLFDYWNGFGLSPNSDPDQTTTPTIDIPPGKTADPTQRMIQGAA